MTDESVAVSSGRVGWRWGWATAALWIVASLGTIALEVVWSGGPSLAFLALVGSALVLESVLVFLTIDRIQERGSRPFTLATGVTLGRGAAAAVLAGFVVAPSPTGVLAWVPALLFAVAAALDAVDGMVARRLDEVTDIGARLDVEMDALVVLVGSLVAVAGDGAALAFLAVGIARYLFVAGLWWRRRRGLVVSELPSNRLRRPLGALVMVCIWLAILPVLSATLTRPLSILVAVPFLANFCWDWLAVSGRR
ncbi:CDP-alcohol phosphatidyltransferase family protein [Natrarchaeobius chitinivorans]|uniref:CDP-alcohol phosphatidyltransferase family protein n=1 Tax=Natrarchaeobius chitinivorans TaxID=1679083 RepID=A0A3N6PA94_NATCH|nr:CDP-alcohol phosphatidyltransferase family protein [Natrarchaeobius chitinivorans]RQG95999.1 CDP-alcohol phosphatidyltransferase family protein [Natrarchaeobius chitinivorans]